MTGGFKSCEVFKVMFQKLIYSLLRSSIIFIFPLVSSCNKTEGGSVSTENTNKSPGGPYQHQILSAISTDGLMWTKDSGIRLEHASVPCAIADGNRIILYYVDADRGAGLPESVGCAITTDGLNFQKQPFIIDGFTFRKAVDPSIIKDNEGNFRLYYLASNMSGDPASEQSFHEIHLATSMDGIHFTSFGVVFKYEGLVDPDVFFYKDTWYMYVYNLVKEETIIATSSDGRSFTYKQSLALRDWGTVAPVQLEEDRLRMYAFEQKKPKGNSVCSFISFNGIDWTAEEGTRLVAGTTEQITDPFVIRWKGTFKMFYKSNHGN